MLRTSLHPRAKRFIRKCALLLTGLGGFFMHAAAQGNGGPSKFAVSQPDVTTEAVEFKYQVPFPGMTKVLLFDENGDMVWRGQYIDKIGPNSLRLRASYLNSGRGYVFQFEYKLERVRIPVVGP